jgi:hypothetical protein
VAPVQGQQAAPPPPQHLQQHLQQMQQMQQQAAQGLPPTPQPGASLLPPGMRAPPFAQLPPAHFSSMPPPPGAQPPPGMQNGWAAPPLSGSLGGAASPWLHAPQFGSLGRPGAPGAQEWSNSNSNSNSNSTGEEHSRFWFPPGGAGPGLRLAAQQPELENGAAAQFGGAYGSSFPPGGPPLSMPLLSSQHRSLAPQLPPAMLPPLTALAAGMPRSLDSSLPFTDGAMFVCTKFTQEECLRRGILGLPRRDLDLVSACTPGRTALFLFNFSSRELHGLFVASSPGRLNWDADAWKRSLYHRPGGTRLGEGRSSPFPAQVRFRVVREYSPLREESFAHLIRSSNRVTQLDAAQVRELIRLFVAHDSRNAPANPTAFLREAVDAQPPHMHHAAVPPPDRFSRSRYMGRDGFADAESHAQAAAALNAHHAALSAAAAHSRSAASGSTLAALAAQAGGGRHSFRGHEAHPPSFGEEESDADAHAAAAAAASVEMLFGDEGGVGGMGGLLSGLNLGGMDSGDEGLCMVCQEQPSDCVLRPCSHAGFCFTCAASLRACPLCNAEVVATSEMLAPQGKARIY